MLVDIAPRLCSFTKEREELSLYFVIANTDATQRVVDLGLWLSFASLNLIYRDFDWL